MPVSSPCCIIYFRLGAPFPCLESRVIEIRLPVRAVSTVLTLDEVPELCLILAPGGAGKHPGNSSCRTLLKPCLYSPVINYDIMLVERSTFKLDAY